MFKVSEEMPKNWTLVELGCIAQLISGVTYKKDVAIYDPQDGYVPLLRANNINKELNYENLVYVPSSKVKEEQFVKEHDIIIAMSSGSKNLVGKAAQAKHSFPGGFGAFCGLVRVNQKLNKRFIGYFFQSDAYRKSISQLSSGVNINNLRRENVLSIKLPLPPLSEQHRIVDKIEELFSKLDVGIESLRKVQAQIKRYRQAVLKHAFEGKLTAAWREANKHRLEPASDIITKKQEVNSKPNDLQIPELPDIWKWSNINSVSEVISGQHILKNDYNEKKGGIPYLTGPIDFGNKYPSIRKWTCKPKAIALKNDVLITVKGAGVGKTNILNIKEAAISRQLMAIRSTVMDPCYIYYYLVSKFPDLQKIGAGSTVPGIDRRSLLYFHIPISPLVEQKQIVEEIERRFSIADRVEEIVEQNLKRAERLRQSILKKAFEGKLVPQDPTDEPASVLLERIKAEKEKSK